MFLKYCQPNYMLHKFFYRILQKSIDKYRGKVYYCIGYIAHIYTDQNERSNKNVMAT